MIGNLEPEETVMGTGGMLGQFALALQALNWDPNDEIVVQIGGCAATGTATHPDSNPKWSKPFGTVSYNNDAFIVIKNKSRSPVVSSQSNPELKPHHHYQGETK
jgi:hypothetical protein